MGLLEDRLKRAIGKTFTGIAMAGTLRREVPGVGTLPNGDPKPGTVETYPFRGWCETYDAAWRSVGIPQNDARMAILAATISTQPKKSEMVELDGKWWMIREVEGVDPAGALIVLQVYETTAP